jgi:hypothetical protein
VSLDCWRRDLLLGLRWQRGIGLLWLHGQMWLRHLLELLGHELNGSGLLVLGESGLLIYVELLLPRLRLLRNRSVAALGS